MRENSNLAVLPFPAGPTTKDKDGGEGGAAEPTQVIIDSTMNGFVLNVHGEEDLCKCFLFHGKDEDGPAAMIQTIIDRLGIADKVKLQK